MGLGAGFCTAFVVGLGAGLGAAFAAAFGAGFGVAFDAGFETAFAATLAFGGAFADAFAGAFAAGLLTTAFLGAGFTAAFGAGFATLRLDVPETFLMVFFTGKSLFVPCVPSCFLCLARPASGPVSEKVGSLTNAAGGSKACSTEKHQHALIARDRRSPMHLLCKGR
jgi:hypothetical protein